MEILMWGFVTAALLSQNLVIPVICISNVEDQKTYYSPDPHTRSPPTGSHGSPPPSHSGSYGTPPSHGGGSYGTPPSHGGSSGSHGGSPPSNCGGTPPSGGHYDPPTTPSLTPPSGGGGYTNPPPYSGGGGTPSTPSYTPPYSGGGGTPSTPSYTPPYSGGGGTPSTPSYSPPITGGGTPLTPVISLTPPTAPIVIPGISVPSPPYVIDPNSPPFPFNYWSTHPALIWGLFGWFGTMGGAFSLSSIPSIPSIPGLGSSTTLLQALSNVRTDGYGALYREGTAALLNSMVDHNFPFTSTQVRDNFVTATHSNKAAAAQAHVFKLANEGRLKI